MRKTSTYVELYLQGLIKKTNMKLRANCSICDFTLFQMFCILFDGSLFDKVMLGKSLT